MMIFVVTRHAAEMQLSIEIDSEPISGSVSVDAGEPQQFSGWIELVAAIESARHVGAPDGGEMGAATGGEGLGTVRRAARGQV